MAPTRDSFQCDCDDCAKERAAAIERIKARGLEPETLEQKMRRHARAVEAMRRARRGEPLEWEAA
jgi:hypothetical protein